MVKKKRNPLVCILLDKYFTWSQRYNFNYEEYIVMWSQNFMSIRILAFLEQMKKFIKNFKIILRL